MSQTIDYPFDPRLFLKPNLLSLQLNIAIAIRTVVNMFTVSLYLSLIKTITFYYAENADEVGL